MPTPRALVITGLLSAVQVALAVTGSGSVPFPTGLNVTILAVPAVVAGVLVGPVAGAIVGAVFGITSFTLAATALFQHPVIAIVPRLLIGPVAALIYRVCRPLNEIVALALAGASAALTNTGLVLLLAVVLPGPLGAPFLAPDAALDVARTSIPWEAALAALVTVVVGLGAKAVAPRR